MSVTFAGRTDPAGVMLRGLPHAVFSMNGPPSDFTVGGFNEPEAQFPVRFPLTGLAHIHWRVKSWKVSGTATEIISGSPVATTWTDVVLDPDAGFASTTGRRPEKTVDLCRYDEWVESGQNVSSITQGGGAIANGGLDAGSATVYLSLFRFDLTTQLSSTGTPYLREIWIAPEDPTDALKGPRYYPKLGISGQVGFYGFGSDPSAGSQVGTATISGVEVPLYSSASGVTANFTFTPNELYGYP